MKIEIRIIKHFGGLVLINGRPRYDITEVEFDGVNVDGLSQTDRFNHVFKNSNWNENSMIYTFKNISKKHVSIKNGVLKFL